MEHYYKLWMFQGLPSEDVLVVFIFYPVVHYLKKFIKFWSIMITFGQMTQMEATLQSTIQRIRSKIQI